MRSYAANDRYNSRGEGDEQRVVLGDHFIEVIAVEVERAGIGI